MREISNLSRDIPVVVPVAALEQHGHHMPVFTDSLLVGEAVRRVGAAMSDRVLIASLMWLGNSHHHIDFHRSRHLRRRRERQDPGDGRRPPPPAPDTPEQYARR